MTLSLASALHVFRNEFPEALERADASSAICAAYGFPQWTAYAMIMRGRAHAALGRADDGIAEMERGWSDWRALGAELATTQMSVGLADACTKAAASRRVSITSRSQQSMPGRSTKGFSKPRSIGCAVNCC